MLRLRATDVTGACYAQWAKRLSGLARAQDYQMVSLGSLLNKAQEEGGRRKCGGVSVLRYSSSSDVEGRPSISLRCGCRPKRAMTSRVVLA
jgi:hypothetical protein